jgi:hypothetical protein
MIEDDFAFGIVTLDIMKLAKDPKSSLINISEKKGGEKIMD